MLRIQGEAKTVFQSTDPERYREFYEERSARRDVLQYAEDSKDQKERIWYLVEYVTEWAIAEGVTPGVILGEIFEKRL